MERLTKEQSAILSAYTGILCGSFAAMHEYITNLLGRPIFTHELGDPKICAEIKDKSRNDFIKICYEE